VSEYTKPLPTTTRLNGPFLEGTKQGELRLQRCEACDECWFPPSTSCPRCLSTRYRWEAASGRGTLWSWIVMHQVYFKSFKDDVPYVVAFVKLAEGPFMMSTIVGTPAALRCDAPVEVTFEDATDEIAVPKFRIVEA
jgi:uncharacterized OB-fold protein